MNSFDYLFILQLNVNDITKEAAFSTKNFLYFPKTGVSFIFIFNLKKYKIKKDFLFILWFNIKKNYIKLN